MYAKLMNTPREITPSELSDIPSNDLLFTMDLYKNFYWGQ